MDERYTKLLKKLEELSDGNPHEEINLTKFEVSQIINIIHIEKNAWLDIHKRLKHLFTSELIRKYDEKDCHGEYKIDIETLDSNYRKLKEIKKEYIRKSKITNKRFARECGYVKVDEIKDKKNEIEKIIEMFKDNLDKKIIVMPTNEFKTIFELSIVMLYSGELMAYEKILKKEE